MSSSSMGPQRPRGVLIWGSSAPGSRAGPSWPQGFAVASSLRHVSLPLHSGTGQRRPLIRTAPPADDSGRNPGGLAYFSSTFAPASSSFFLISAASALLTPSLTAFGAASTRSLASLRPSPVTARTSLITLIFLSPAATRITENSSCSATGAAATEAAAATATGAAADTPHASSSFLLSSAASMTVSLESSSTNFCRSAIVIFSYGLELLGSSTGLVRVGPENTRELTRRRPQNLGDTRRRGLQHADELAAQLIQRRQGCERLDPVGVEQRVAHRPADDGELFVRIGVADRHLRGSHRIGRIGDRRWPLEERRQLGELRAFESATSEPILRHFEAGTGLPHLPPKVRHFGDRQAGLLSHDDQLRLGQDVMQGVDQLLLLRSVHLSSPMPGPSGMIPIRPVAHGSPGTSPVDPVRLSQKFKPPPAHGNGPLNGCPPAYCGRLAQLSPRGRVPSGTRSLGQVRGEPTGRAPLRRRPGYLPKRRKLEFAIA